MIRTTPKVASVPSALLATADTEAVSMIATEMAIRVRVCFLTRFIPPLWYIILWKSGGGLIPTNPGFPREDYSGYSGYRHIGHKITF
jgi:hypothetical protein